MSEGGGHPVRMLRVMIVTTELVKWATIVGVVYLTVWQYSVVAGYTVFFSSSDNVAAQYYGLISIIIISISLLLYLPWRVVAVRFRHKYKVIKDDRWRPAIVGYILVCAIPCFAMMLAAYKSESTYTSMTPTSITVLQMVVMGLVVTEWMIKIQQEEFSFELITAMAFDFFFAYDVIAFVMMATIDPDVYQSGWVYAGIVFAVVAMFKYVPTQPLNFAERRSSIGHVVCIVTSMLCNDLPFVTIRLATMIVFGFLISDMIFLLKNVFVILFNCIQLGVIYHNMKSREVTKEAAGDVEKSSVDTGGDVEDAAWPSTSDVRRESRFKEAVEGVIQHRRMFRGHDVWCDPFDEACVMSNRVMDDAHAASAAHVNNRSSTSSTLEDVSSHDNEAFDRERPHHSP